MKQKSWERIGSKIIYKNPWIKLYEDKVIKLNGKRGIYSLVATNGPSVYIIPLTENHEVYLIRQYRYATKTDSWELPGGSSSREKILAAAKRELLEETGLVAKTWKKIGRFQAFNGICDEIAYVFMAKNLAKTKSGEMEKEGIDKIKKVPFKKILSMIKTGEISDGQSIAALTIAYLNLEGEKSYV